MIRSLIIKNKEQRAEFIGDKLSLEFRNTEQSLQINNGVRNIIVEGGSSYFHDQASAATLWTVNHNLGRYPNVTSVDSTKREIKGIVAHVSTNQLTITFTAANSGEAYVS